MTNGINALQQTTILDVIGKFVGFKILIQIQDAYLKARPNFAPMKSEVGKSPLEIDANVDRIFGSK